MILSPLPPGLKENNAQVSVGFSLILAQSILIKLEMKGFLFTRCT